MNARVTEAARKVFGQPSRLLDCTIGYRKPDDSQVQGIPSVLIPLGGMIFAASMNAVSLSAERLDAEQTGGSDYENARRIAIRSALIPQINILFAVGLVSLPGMMTGQILSGIAPLIAARYQLMVMCMLFGAGGISAACFLLMQRPRPGRV